MPPTHCLTRLVAPTGDGLNELVNALRRAPACTALLNYHMSTAGQRPYGGHVSPLGAYHAGSGRFLVLDTWPHTTATWLSATCLWAALAATDPESGRSRGWLLVSSDSSMDSSSACSSSAPNE